MSFFSQHFCQSPFSTKFVITHNYIYDSCGKFNFFSNPDPYGLFFIFLLVLPQQISPRCLTHVVFLIDCGIVAQHCLSERLFHDVYYYTQLIVYCVTSAGWGRFQTSVLQHETTARVAIFTRVKSALSHVLHTIFFITMRGMYNFRWPRIGAECTFFSKCACATGRFIFPFKVSMRNG